MKNICLFILASLCLHQTFAQNSTTSTGAVATGSSSVLCTAGSFTNKDNVTTPTFNDYAHFSLAVGIGCSYWLGSTLNTTAAAGTYAGFHIRSSNLLNLLAGIKVETYLNGTLRESMNGASLLNVITGGEGDVYFQATKTYNETRIVMGGPASVAYEVDIFYGYGMTTPPTGAVLPLSFTAFRADRQDGDVALSWSINSDESIRTMEVERSLDGNNFTPVGFADPGAASSFSYVDHNNAEAYYRIRVTTATRGYYSRILHVGGETASLSISCNNPVNDQLSITISAATGSQFLLELITLDGRTAMSRNLGLHSPTAEVTLQRGGLQPGIYLLRITGADGSNAVRKLVFQ